MVLINHDVIIHSSFIIVLVFPFKPEAQRLNLKVASQLEFKGLGIFYYHSNNNK